MSIYRSRYGRSPDDDKEQPTRPRVIPVPASAPPPALPPASPAQDPARLRKAKPAGYLLPASVNWLKSLPRAVRPIALAAKYARIVNLIVQHWNDYNACCAYLDDLLTDHRGNRQGFPRDVHRELWTLRDYYQRMRIAAGDRLSLL